MTQNKPSNIAQMRKFFSCYKVRVFDIFCRSNTKIHENLSIYLPDKSITIWVYMNYILCVSNIK